jgi:hypothetical protein
MQVWTRKPKVAQHEFCAALGLMAAATAAAAAASTARGAARGRGGAAGARRGEDGELDRGFFAGALGAGDFLLFVDDDFLELGFAVFADVFVDWHWYGPWNVLLDDYSRIGGLLSGRNLRNRLPPRGVYFSHPHTQILENAMGKSAPTQTSNGLADVGWRISLDGALGAGDF